MSAVPAPSAPRRLPPVAELATVSLALIVVGGIYMAATFPEPPVPALPVILLVASAGLMAVNLLLISRIRGFAWSSFARVGGWALVAYTLSAAMIAYAFIRDGAEGGSLLVVLLMLVIFATDVPLIIAFTVARYQVASAGSDTST